jgi:hypothetical protein
MTQSMAARSSAAFMHVVHSVYARGEVASPVGSPPGASPIVALSPVMARPSRAQTAAVMTGEARRGAVMTGEVGRGEVMTGEVGRPSRKPARRRLPALMDVET